MSVVYNKETGKIIRSAHTPDYQDDKWAVNPDLSEGIDNVPLYYRKLEKGRVSEMTQSEKTAVDVGRIPAIKENECSKLKSELAKVIHESDNDKVLESLSAIEAKYCNAIKQIDAAKTLAEIASAKETLNGDFIEVGE